MYLAPGTRCGLQSPRWCSFRNDTHDHTRTPKHHSRLQCENFDALLLSSRVVRYMCSSRYKADRQHFVSFFLFFSLVPALIGEVERNAGKKSRVRDFERRKNIPMSLAGAQTCVANTDGPPAPQPKEREKTDVCQRTAWKCPKKVNLFPSNMISIDCGYEGQGAATRIGPCCACVVRLLAID